MKKTILLLIIVTMLVSQSYAGIRSSYIDKTSRFLHEKIGKQENLLDNPARLNKIRSIIIEDNSHIMISHQNPYDAVYEKHITDEQLINTFYTVTPINKLFTLSAGYQYEHLFDNSKSTSGIDASVIDNRDKQFGRNIYAALATGYFQSLSIGYAFGSNDQCQVEDFYSDIATNYHYQNSKAMMNHKAGIVINNIDIMAGYATETYFGYYNDVQEIDMAITTITIQGRKLLGETGKENLLIQAGFSRHELVQNMFELGRSGYQLEMPANEISVSAYYLLPIDLTELALGVEVDYRDGNQFDVSDYEWQTFEKILTSIPLSVTAKLLDCLKMWVEVKLQYNQTMMPNKQSLSFTNAFGMQVDIKPVALDIYMMPILNAVIADDQDEGRAFQLGLTVTLEL